MEAEIRKGKTLGGTYLDPEILPGSGTLKRSGITHSGLMTEKIYEFSEIPYLSQVPRLIWGILHSLTISRITCRLKLSSPAQRKIIRWARTSCQPPPDTVAVAMSAIQIHHVEKITKIKRNTSTKYVSLTMRSQFIYFKK